MASKEQLQAVASHCSQFKSLGEGTFTASIQSSRTCENCIHFTNDHKCDINLVDKILIRLTNEG